MNQKKLIELELEHFYKERESVKKEMQQAKNSMESMQARQRMLMIKEIIAIKKERLKKECES